MKGYLKCEISTVYSSCDWLQLAADPDQNVRSGSELLDRLLKVNLIVHVTNNSTI